eukprot:TRINITY_DN721_c0_g1_i2.p1 TRINITY_DN721_c0_g1~~TRINITY_DN721_c0_g1_i2.p1  ORF type:complete len:225 (-),score=78.57 TRINITY_DN721_c0_g1_i2:444-1118(-)
MIGNLLTTKIQTLTKKFIETQNNNDSESALKKKKKLMGKNGGSDPATASSSSSTLMPPSAAAADSSARGSPEDSDGEDVLGAMTQPDSTVNIPIFTDQFIEHNKARENELRQLRKQTTEFEEQNAVLTKHIESMKTAITKLEMETQQQRQNNASLQQHLQSLRQLVTQGFKGVQVPGFKNVTEENIDEIVCMLLGIVKENPLQHQPLIHTAKSIVATLDYSKIV